MEKDVHVSTARDLVTRFGSGLEGHVYGSPKLVSRQMDVVSNLVDNLVGMIADHGTKLLCDSSEESITFLDLPKEILSEILKRVQDHVSILEAAKAHEVLNALVTQESRLWKSLANFHFTQEQIQKHNVRTFNVKVIVTFFRSPNSPGGTFSSSSKNTMVSVKSTPI